MMRRAHGVADSLGIDRLQIGFLIGAVVFSAAIGDLSVSPGYLRLAVLGAVGCAAIGLGFLAPQALLVTLVCWLAALGLLRRLVSVNATSTTTDPLLPIGPLTFVVLFLIAVQTGAM